MRRGRYRPRAPDHYEAYLKGRFFWNKRTKADLEVTERELPYLPHSRRIPRPGNYRQDSVRPQSSISEPVYGLILS